MDIDPDEIEVYTSPWVGGTRAEAYYGCLNVSRFTPRDGGSLEDHYEAAERAVIIEIREMAAKLGANSLVGFEMMVDPYAEEGGVPGTKYTASATAARLVPLF